MFDTRAQGYSAIDPSISSRWDDFSPTALKSKIQYSVWSKRYALCKLKIYWNWSVSVKIRMWLRSWTSTPQLLNRSKGRHTVLLLPVASSLCSSQESSLHQLSRSALMHSNAISIDSSLLPVTHVSETSSLFLLHHAFKQWKRCIKRMRDSSLCRQYSAVS